MNLRWLLTLEQRAGTVNISAMNRRHSSSEYVICGCPFFNCISLNVFSQIRNPVLWCRWLSWLITYVDNSMIQCSTVYVAARLCSVKCLVTESAAIKEHWSSLMSLYRMLEGHTYSKTFHLYHIIITLIVIYFHVCNVSVSEQQLSLVLQRWQRSLN